MAVFGKCNKVVPFIERSPVHEAPVALCSLYPSPTSLQAPDSFMESSEYTTALIKPFLCANCLMRL